MLPEFPVLKSKGCFQESLAEISETALLTQYSAKAA
jgi:hypothetical protein